MTFLFDPHFQAEDANGLPYSGAKLTFYQATTTTPITTYQDYAKNASHTSPVVADTAGRFAPIWVDTSPYKWVLTTSGGTIIQTVDNVYATSYPGTAFSPQSSGGADLGSTSLPWGNVYIKSGGKLDFNNGDVTFTHSANTMAFAGASSGYTFDATISVSGSNVVTTATLTTLGTSVATTSGTSIDFTSIPSWVKRITVSLSGVSTNGTSILLLQLGDSGGIEATGYDGENGSISGGSTPANASNTAGFALPSASASATRSGSITLTLLDPATNTWACFGIISEAGVGSIGIVAGAKSTSAALDRVRLTATNGTDTFDAGKMNIAYS